MKIGYFTFENIRIAETFISDLMQKLSNIDEVVWYSGQKDIPMYIIKNQIAIGFSPYNCKVINFIFKLLQIKISFAYKIRMKLRLLYSKRALKRLNSIVEVAYVEFLTTAVLVREFFEEKNIPYIVHVHAYDITSELNDTAYADEIQKVFKSAKKILAPSEYIKKLLVLQGCPIDKIEVVRLGIDTQSITPLSWSERFENPPSLVFLGRLVEKKNPVALLYSLDIVKKHFPDIKLIIIGKGPLRSKIEEVTKELNLENSVVLTGALPREKSFPVLNRSWIYVQHSITTRNGDKEGAPVSISEASAHALPVVSTIHSGIPEQVIDGETGFLVQECDYTDMAQKIIKLLNSRDLMVQMGKSGRNYITKLNCMDCRVDKIYKILYNACNR